MEQLEIPWLNFARRVNFLSTTTINTILLDKLVFYFLYMKKLNVKTKFCIFFLRVNSIVLDIY